MNCTACGAPNDPGAKFCGGCGKPLVAASAPSPFAATAFVGAPPPAAGHPPAGTVAMPAMPMPGGAPPPPAAQQPAPIPHQHTGPALCAACGASFVTGHCDRCGGTQGMPGPVPTQGVYWMQLRLSIKCMQCQKPSPLSRLSMTGEYFCYGCGREQLFDADLWKEYVFDTAAALGDAHWGNLQVFPPWPPVDPSAIEDKDDLIDGYEDDLVEPVMARCREVGRTANGLSLEQGGMSMGSGGFRTRGIQLALAPGHPLCPTCKAPLDVAPTAEGVVTASCARCHTSTAYRLPAEAKERCSTLVGVIAPEHIEGRPTAKVLQQPGSAALGVLCPQCGSALSLAPGERMAACAFCKTTSVIPEHIAAVGAPAPAHPDPIWLGFRAPSPLRMALLTATSPKAPEPTQAPPMHQQVVAPTPKSSNAGLLLAIPGVLVGLAVVGGVGASQYFRHRADTERELARKSEGHDTAKTSAPPAPVPTEPVAIPSCVCAFAVGETQTTLTVDAPPQGSAKGWMLEVEKTQGFISQASSRRFPAQAGALLPPAGDAGAPAKMGIACDSQTFVLVGDTTATGWSSGNGAWRWNATLPAAAVVDAPDAGATAGSDYTGGCSPLSVKNGAVALTLANGKHATLALKDGKLR